MNYPEESITIRSSLIGCETDFRQRHVPEDISLVECEPHIRRLAEMVWIASKDNARGAKTVVLKLKTKGFQ